MPTDACQYFYDCKGCGALLKPLPGDCCVFCSYGSVPCPPVLCRPKPPMIGSVTLARVCWRGGFLTPWSLQGYSRVSPRGRPFGSPRLFGWGPPASSMPDDPDAPIAVSPGLTI